MDLHEAEKQDRLLAAEVFDEIFDVYKWSQKLPYLNFKDDWLVKPMPCRLGALVRFRVTTSKIPDWMWVIVYFDAFDLLGVVGEPYWEICWGPRWETTLRFIYGKEDAMMEAIAMAINELEEGYE